MIHLLGWMAIALTSAYSYRQRLHLDPNGVLEHRAGLPALGFGLVMAAIIVLLVVVFDLGGAVGPVEIERTVLWVPVT